MTLGSLDFFFDKADELEKLGTEFCLMVKHPQDKSVVILCNVKDKELGVAMTGALARAIRDKFSGEPEDEDPSPDSDLAD